ncbi:MAG: SH3 domain-containing protein [Clostridia bacterium]|nr:SH3 domain-containing protein [Clostridia bacterium]
MKRRILSGILALMLCTVCLLCSIPALAETKTVYVCNPNPADRLNLRQLPDQHSVSLGRYYNGTQVELLTTENEDWAKVRIGTLEGYMMTEFLTADAKKAVAAMPGYRSTSSAWEVYRTPDRTGAYEMHGYGEQVLLLGFTREWWHIQAGNDIGFVPSGAACLEKLAGAYADGYMTATVSNPDPAQRLNLRREANAKSPSLGRYYNGCTVAVLSPADGGWYKVRIGTLEGYMDGRYLAFSTVAEPAMPVYTATSSGWELYSLPDKTSEYTMCGNNSPVILLGFTEDWWHVSVNDRIGFVPANAKGFRPQLSNSIIAGESAAVVANPDPAQRLNLRTKPAESSISLGKYYNGCIVTLLDRAGDDWYKVRIGELTGYMKRAFLDTASPADPAMKALPSVTVANQSGAALHESADAASPLCYHYPAGTTVQVLGVGASWCHVSIDGCAGFMRLADLEPRLSFADSGK